MKLSSIMAIFNFFFEFKMSNKQTKTSSKKKKFQGKHYEKTTLRKAAFSHPHPMVQRKCLAVLLLMFLFSAALVGRILGLSPTTIRTYWQLYKQGGIKELEKLGYKGSKNTLKPHGQTIEQAFEENPPHTISEAVERVQKITGIKKSAKSVRTFLKNLNFSYRKVASIPAKADLAKQAQFLISSLYPCLQEATKGSRTVLFLDAAHFVHGSFLGCLWSKVRLFIKSPSGRKRLNVLGAVNAITKQLHIFSNETYINSGVLCDFLQEMAKTYVDRPITIILDNARYQRCKLVEEFAKTLGIQLLFLPSYSPNLNIIERVWKFLKKKVLNARYYETFGDFKAGILRGVSHCNGEWSDELESLLALNFQTFSSSGVSLPSFDEHIACTEEILGFA